MSNPPGLNKNGPNYSKVPVTSTPITVPSIKMPFNGNGAWPAIGHLQASSQCRNKQGHRLYRAMGIECPCGPCCLTINDHTKHEVQFFGDDIVFLQEGHEVLKLSDLVTKIHELEQEVKELKNGRA